jgi:hypothetical protein
MQKLTHILIAAVFGLGCVGLWLLLGILQMIYEQHLEGRALPQLTQFCLELRQWFLVLPVPFVSFSVLSLFRRRSSPEICTLHLAVAALLFVLLFFTVAIGALLPWLTLRMSMGG